MLNHSDRSQWWGLTGCTGQGVTHRSLTIQSASLASSSLSDPPAPSSPTSPSSSSPHLHLLFSLPPTSLLKGGYRSASIRSMKTMMMNNDQTAASSVAATSADGLCERVMPHLLHNTRREEPDDVWIFWVTSKCWGCNCFDLSRQEKCVCYF